MSIRNICAIVVGVFALSTPSVDATSINQILLMGAFGEVYASTDDGCTYSSLDVYASEVTVKRQGTFPSGYVSVYAYNRCTGQTSYSSGSSTNVTFSHTPATRGSFPTAISLSGDITLTEAVTGVQKSIHVEMELMSAGGRHESVESSHEEYPDGDQVVKVDFDAKSHRSGAIGSLDISGALQYTNPSMTGSVGVATYRSHTVVHS